MTENTNLYARSVIYYDAECSKDIESAIQVLGSLEAIDPLDSNPSQLVTAIASTLCFVVMGIYQLVTYVTIICKWQQP